MAWPLTAILDVLVEMQLSTLEWVDITAYVYGDPEAQHIEIQRGRTAEGSSVGAGVATLRLKNTDGRFSSRNPRSPWYGLFGRNTPIRVCVRPRFTTGALADLSDAFGRTVALGNNWGTADTGQSWIKTTPTLASKLSVSSGKGHALVSSAGDSTVVMVSGALWKDVDAYISFTFPAATGSGSLFAQLSTRTVEAGTTQVDRGLRLRCEMTTTAAVKLEVLSTFPEGDAGVISTVTIAGLTHTGQQLRMRMRLAGITVMGKVWAASGSEPASWQILVDDTTSLIAKPAGTVLISTQAGTGNTNVPFTADYDDITITAIEPRYCGELTSIPPRWTIGAPTIGAGWVPVASAGILGRLSSVQDQPKSALWRFIEANQTGLIGYWSLSAGEPAGVANTRFQRPVLGTLTRKPVAQGGAVVVTSDTDMGSGTLAEWLEPGASWTAGGFITLDRPDGPHNAGAGWALDWVRAGAQNTDGPFPERLSFGTALTVGGNTFIFWEIDFDAADSNVTIVDPTLANHTASLTPSGFYDGGMHAIRFTTAKSGSNITYNFLVDGTSVLSGSVADPYGNGADTLTEIGWQIGGAQNVAYGHIAFWDTNAPSASEFADAALGHPGEDTVGRIVRVCGEQALPYYALGTDTSTGGELLGPQPISTPFGVIAAAAAADQGVLAELRDANGILYYAREALYSQSATTLDYTTDGHLQGVPEPTDDDVFVVNTATVTRQFASSRTFEQTTGVLGSAGPPAGVGRKPGDTTLNLVDDVRTLHAAEWLVAAGTVDDSRWPVIPVALHHLAAHSLYTVLADVLATDAGFRLAVDNPPSFLPPAAIDQIVLGSSETIDQMLWTVQFNCAPYAPYRVGIWSGTDEFLGRWDGANSTLAAGATSSATSLSVATASGSLWTTSAGDLPFDIGISGVRITVTNITGGTSPQTFTVTRSVDGFDIALTSGAAVSLWQPSIWGL